MTQRRSPVRLGAALGLAAALDAGAAAADPLWQAEARVGYGVQLSGAGAVMSRRPSSLVVGAIAAIAVEDTPRISGYGGLIVEALNRTSVGTTFGVRLALPDSRVRVAAGGTYVMAPYTLWGATASAGACARATAHLGLCGDLELTAFLAGDDLGEGRTVTQVQLVVGMVFDAP